jgi:prepilin-type N-terminal cleavage/methylation domain-containing protein
MRTSRPLNRSGFTLTELLVVIVIIAILVGMLMPAVQYVRRRAKRTSIRVDLQNLEGAVEAYKQKFLDYPPDFSRKDIVRRHIMKAWPRIDSAEMTLAWATFWVDPADNNNHLSYVDPAEALVFWTGGFSSNAKFPFTGTGGPWVVDGTGNVYYNPERIVGPADFDKERLTLNTTPVMISPTVAGLVSNDTGGSHAANMGVVDPFPVFLPQGRTVPYVYFDSRSYGGVLSTAAPVIPLTGFYSVPGGPLGGHGLARPYTTIRQKPTSVFGFEWVNETTFQIISAGLDDHYGSDAVLTGGIAFFPRYPSGDNYLTPSPGDDDNITNFSEGSMKGAGK